MNYETIIRKAAEKFYQYGDWSQYTDAPERFKSDLSLKLYDYSDNEGKLIFLYEVWKNIQIEYDDHLKDCRHKEHPEKCDDNLRFATCLLFTEQEIKELNSEYNFAILRPEVNVDLVHDNLKLLSEYPGVGTIYQRAIEKLNQKLDERSVLDDLRLCYETLLKEVLSNTKSIENQNSDLGNYLQQLSVSKELTNMILKLHDYYGKYQNTFVKHNDSVNPKETDMIVNLTSSIIHFIINNRT
jgi:hypothetical protein